MGRTLRIPFAAANPRLAVAANSAPQDKRYDTDYSGGLKDPSDASPLVPSPFAPDDAD
jgi:hypothetical protein